MPIRFETWFGAVEISDGPVYKVSHPFAIGPTIGTTDAHNAQQPQEAGERILPSCAYERDAEYQVATIEAVCNYLKEYSCRNCWTKGIADDICYALRADAQRVLAEARR